MWRKRVPKKSHGATTAELQTECRSTSPRPRLGFALALGASSGDVLRMVVGHGLVVTAIGLAIGLIAAIPLTRSIETLLFEVKPMQIVGSAQSTISSIQQSAFTVFAVPNAEC
jgi:FtsX-like permease family